MQSHWITGVALLFLLVSSPSQAQETHTIKVKPTDEAGRSYLYKSSEAKKTIVKTMDDDGNLLSEITETSGLASARRVSVLKWDDEFPISAHVTYEKQSTITDGTERTSPLQGKKVRLEKDGGAYVLRLDDGKDLTQEQLADVELEHFLNSMALSVLTNPKTLPSQAVKLNEEWAVDAELVNGGNLEKSKVYDMDKSSFKAKLTRVYQKDGKTFGTIDFHFVLPFKQGPLDKHVHLVDGKLVLRATFDGCIDGSVAAATLKSTQSMEMNVTEDFLGEQTATHLRVTNVSEESHQELKK